MDLSVFATPATFANWAFGSGWHYLLCGIPASLILAGIFFFGHGQYEDRNYENVLRGFLWGLILWPLAYIGIGCIFFMWLMDE